MRYHDITKDDMKNGDGLRVVLWLSGCAHHCPGCQNPVTWDPQDGLLFDREAKKEVAELMGRPYISGLTLSGGDPLFSGNVEEVTAYAKEIRESFPEKTIWLYTGETWEDIRGLEIMKYIDVLVDGRFEEEKKDNRLHWKGSGNQRVIDVQESLKQKKTVIHG